MRKLLFLLLTVYTITANAQSADSLDAKNGYKDVPLGISLDSLKKITKVKTGLIKLETDHVLYFWGTNSKYTKFGEYSVSCAFGFYKKEMKLSDVLLLVADPSRYKYNELVQFFTVLYGEPTKTQDAGDLTAWVGSKVKLAVSYDWARSSLTINIVDIELRDKIEADEEAKIKKDTKDF